MAAAAQGQDGAAKASADFGDAGRIIQAGLLECSEGIRGKHLGPFIGVIPGRVSAREDVRKRT